MIVYIDSESFSTATTVYLDSLLSEIAPDGYYSSQGYYRHQVDGKLVDILQCPEIDTVSITGVGETTATFNGNFISNGGDTSAVRGFVYSISPNPTIANSVVTDTIRAQGTYSLNVTGLTSEVTYYVRAYTIVFGETIYGDQLNFTTVVNSVEWSEEPYGYGGDPSGGFYYINGTVEIIGDPVTFRGFVSIPDNAGPGSFSSNIWVGTATPATERYVEVARPRDVNNEAFSTSFTLPAGTYNFEVNNTWFGTGGAGEGGIVWTQ